MQENLYQIPGDPDPDAQIETVIKAVLVLDGTELCTIGDLPGHVAARPGEAAHLHNKFAQIIELYQAQQVYTKLWEGIIYTVGQRFSNGVKRGLVVSTNLVFFFLLTIVNQKLLEAFGHNNNPG